MVTGVTGEIRDCRDMVTGVTGEIRHCRVHWSSRRDPLAPRHSDRRFRRDAHWP